MVAVSRRAVGTTVVVTLLAVVLVIGALHLRPARSAIAAWMVDALEARYPIAIRIGGLDYNLTLLDVRVRDVEIGRADAAATPFFRAPEIDLSLNAGTLLGKPAIRSLVVRRAVVVVAVDSDGRSNLPDTGTQGDDLASTSSPSSTVPIDSVRLSDLTVQWSDARRDSSLDLHGLRLDLDTTGAGLTGALSQEGEARFRLGGNETVLDTLDAGILYDATGLTLRQLRLATPEATVQADVAITDPFGAAGLDGRFTASVILDEMAPWLGLDGAVGGSVDATGTLGGRLADPRIGASLESRDLRWATVEADRASIECTWDGTGLRVDRLAMAVNDATLEASGQLAVEPDLRLTAEAHWQAVPTQLLERLLPEPPSVVIATRLTGTGTIDWSRAQPQALRFRIESENAATSRPGIPFNGRLVVDATDGTWTLQADERVAGTLSVAARLRGRLADDAWLSSSVQGALSAVTDRLSALTAAPSLRRFVPDALRMADGAARATLDLTGTLANPRVAGRVESSDLRFADSDLQLDRLDARLLLDGDRLRVQDLEAHQGSNLVQGEAVLDRADGSVDGRFQARLEDLSSLRSDPPSWWPDGGATLDGRITGALTRPAIALDVMSDRMLIVGQAVDQLSGALRFTSGEIQLDRLQARLGSGIGRANGQYDLPTGRLRFEMQGEGIRLQPTTLDETTVPLAGRANLDLTVEGTADDVTSQGTLELLDLSSDEIGLAGGTVSASVRLDGALDALDEAQIELELRAFDALMADEPVQLDNPTRITYDRGTLAVERFAVVAGGTRLEIAGRLSPGSTDTLTASLEGDLHDLLPLSRGIRQVREFETIGVDSLAGRIGLRGSLTYGADGLVGSADLSVENATARLGELPPATGIELRASYRDGDLEIAELHGTWQQAVLDAQATIPEGTLSTLTGAAPDTGGAPAVLSARVQSIGADVLAPVADQSVLERLSVTADAELALTFDRFAREAANGRLTLTRVEGTAVGMPFRQDRPTRLVLEAGHLTVSDWSWSGQANQFQVDGALDLTRPDGLDVEVQGVIDLRLANLVVPAVASSGRSPFALWLRGEPADPLIDGSILLEGAEARVANPRVVFTDLDGQIVLTDDTLELTELTGTVNGGTLTAKGTLEHDEFAVDAGSITIVATGAAMQFPEGLRSEVNADVTLRVSGNDLALTGVTTIVRGSYREPITVTSQLLTALSRENVSVRLADESSMLDRIALDVAIVTDDDILVDNNYGRFSLGSDLRLIGTIARPSLTGRAAIREGGLLYLSGNTYQLEASSLDFANPTRIEPDLDITARTRISGYDITMRVTGTPSELETELSSDPSLGQSDVISLLLTGRTLDEAGGAGAEVAGEQVLGYLSGELAGVAGRAVGLDVLRIERGTTANDVRFDPGLVATETNPAARLTFGKRVRRDLELIFSQSLAKSGDFTWIVNYSPYRTTTLRFVSRDNEDRSYEFWHDLSFGGAGLPASRARVGPRETVDAIEFSGSPGFEDQELLDMLRLSPGDGFDFYRWQEDRDRLVRFYRDRGYLEASVRTRQRRLEAGHLVIEYDLVRGPRTILTVEGYDVSDDTRDQMIERWSASIFDRFLEEDLVRLARRDLAMQRYLRAEVETEIVRDETADSKTIVVRANSGQAFRSIELRFDGNATVPPDRLRRAAEGAGPLAWAFLDPGPVVEALENLYRASGLLNAQVEADPPAFEDDRATLTIAIREGPTFRIGNIQFDGLQARSEQDARATLGVSAGDTFEPNRVEEARRRLDESYRRQGFNDVSITVDAEPESSTGDVQLIVRVTEGRQHVLSSVNVEGLHDTKPALVTRALRFTIGDPVDLRAWYRARKRLYDTGAFRRVDLNVQPVDETPDSPDAQQPVVTTVTLEEWPRYRLRYGFQINDEHTPEREAARTLAPGLVADLTRRNLFGRAIRAGLATRLQRRQQAGRLFLSMPALFGRPITSNFFVSQSRMDFGDSASPFISTETNATAEQRFGLGAIARVSYGYTFGHTHTFERDPDPLDPFPFDVVVDIARFTTTTTLDTRDDLLDTRRGWFHSSSFEYASELLGSDLRFAKYLAQQLYFQTLPGNVVLGTAVRVGLASAFGQELIPSERFFAGGGNTVRGYPDDSLGARTFLGDPAGGEALFILNQEVRVPLGRHLQGVGFFDAGRPFASIGDFALRDLSASVGLGVRIRTPVVLLRVDFGQPLDRIDGRRPSGRLFFSIGQMF